jgi:hypothetical protein
LPAQGFLSLIMQTGSYRKDFGQSSRKTQSAGQFPHLHFGARMMINEKLGVPGGGPITLSCRVSTEFVDDQPAQSGSFLVLFERKAVTLLPVRISVGSRALGKSNAKFYDRPKASVWTGRLPWRRQPGIAAIESVDTLVTATVEKAAARAAQSCIHDEQRIR